MNKPINEILTPLHGYLLSIERDVDNSAYVINMGIPASWTYKSTNVIESEVVASSDKGTLLKIFGKNDNIVIDDLIEYSRIIIETNERIQKMQEEFDKKMIEMKEKLIQEQRSFLDELDEMKDKSFHEIEEKVTALNNELEKQEADAQAELEEKLGSI
jgi:hypothetical protein